MSHLRYILIILLLCISRLTYSQVIDSDTILWKDNFRLTFPCFRAIPDTNVTFAAMSAIKVGYASTIQNDTLIIKVYCSFLINYSWIKEYKQEIVDHEQVHFDIGEYYKRLLVKGILNSRFTKKNYKDTLYSLYKENVLNRNYTNKIYDQETDHSLNKKKQKQWASTISQNLLMLKNYDRSEIRVILNKK